MADKYKPKVGDRVILNDDCGTVRYVGKIAGIKGSWVGLELDDRKGKNDGSAKGKRYFSCPKNHGIFCKAKKIKPLVKRLSKSKTKSDVSVFQQRRVSIPGLVLTPMQEPHRLSETTNDSPSEKELLFDESLLDVDTPIDGIPSPFRNKNQPFVNNWLKREHVTGSSYWVNPITQESTWAQPTEWSEETENQEFRKKADVKGEAQPWVQITDPKSGRCYWANIETQESTWTQPEGWDTNIETKCQKNDEVMEIRKKRQALKNRVKNRLSRGNSQAEILEKTENTKTRSRSSSLDNLRKLTEKAISSVEQKTRSLTSSVEQKTRSIRSKPKDSPTGGKDLVGLVRRRSGKKKNKPMLELDLGGKSPMEKQLKRERMKKARERMKKIKKNTLEMHGTNLRLLPLRRLQRRLEDLEVTIAANDVLIQKELKLAKARAKKRQSNHHVGEVLGRDFFVH